MDPVENAKNILRHALNVSIPQMMSFCDIFGIPYDEIPWTRHREARQKILELILIQYPDSPSVNEAVE